MRINKVLLLFFLITGLFSSQSFCGEDTIRQLYMSGIDRYGMDNGLSHSSIKSLHQDSLGFIWIGTGNGLNKFDGYKFTLFTPPDFEHTRLIINGFADGDSGNIWLATDIGLFKFNTFYEKFTAYRNNVPNFNSYYTNNIKKIIRRSANEFIIFSSAGAYIFDKKHNFFEPLLYFSNNAYYPLEEEIADAVLHNNKELLFLTNKNHLHVYNLLRKSLTKVPIPGEPFVGEHTTKKIKRLNDSIYLVSGRLLSAYNIYNHTISEIKAFSSYKEEYNTDNLHMLAVENDSTVWISTKDNCLIVYKPLQNKIIKAVINKFSESNTFSKSYSSFLFDQNNILWMGTTNQGLLKFDQLGNDFENYTYLHGNPNSLSSNFIYGLLYDDDADKLYTGTEEGNIDIISFKEMVIEHQNPNDFFPEKSFHIAGDIVKDRDGNTWISYYSGGVIRIDTLERWHHYYPKPDPDQPNNIHGYSFRKILVDSRNTIWVAGFDQGLQVYNKSKDKFEKIIAPRRPDDFLTKIWTLYETTDNTIYIGSENYGVIKGVRNTNNPDKLTFRLLNSSKQNIEDHAFPGFIRCIYEDKDGLLWIGSAGSGLTTFNTKTSETKTYSTANGLSSNIVYAIISDKLNNLWLSTENGISKLNTATERITNYYQSDGIQSNQFYMLSEAQSDDGKIFFGGTHGITSFFPEKITQNKQKPKVAITEFKILNELVLPGSFNGYEILAQPISLTNSIELPYKYNTFSFEFTGLHFSNPEKNKFRYKLQNIEDWIEVGAERRFASYTALPPGNYTFYLQAANNDGLWSEEALEINVKINPPWYLTWQAITFYFILIFGMLLLFRQFSLASQKIKNEMELERVKAEKMREIDQSKLRFFTNISHEFRTPLTLMLGPLDKLTAENHTSNPENRSFMYGLMKRNTLRLLRLINQVLDTSRVEAGNLKLRVKEDDISKCLSDIHSSFAFVAESKNIYYTFEKEDARLNGFFDHDKVEKIFYNLLSNAFKYTPAAGTVSVHLAKIHTEKGKACQIVVSDTGMGVKEEDKQKIFDLFYQSTDDSRTSKAGSGIGLALTKRLVELHNGNISVDNGHPGGTIFSVIIPLEKSAYHPDEINENMIPVEEHNLNLSLKQPIENDLEATKNYALNATKKEINNDVLLIVEDNSDLRTFIKYIFHEGFTILEAVNGQQGLQMAKQTIPDLIISDIVMPEMDGIEMCQKLREGLATSHIPVLLLSSRAGEDDVRQGFENGAIEYITKPFSERLLQLRVNNLLAFRNKSRQLITDSGSSSLLNSLNKMNSLDHSFIKEVTNIIEENISNTGFSVELLSESFSLSRSHFYRKLKAVTGKSPNDYIRFIRLQKAKMLLVHSPHNISEISYMVGFNDPKYFSRCFKKEYGKAPTAVNS